MMPSRNTQGRSAQGWAYLPEYALANLPRYTSYPPANRFTNQVGATDAATAMAALPDESDISLYVHIPFCKKLCWYCGCHTSVPTVADPVEPYLDALAREVQLVGERIGSRTTVSHLHFGGGSPDILKPRQVDFLMQVLRRTFRFNADAEVAAELDPRGASEDVVKAFAANGLTRASFGVQVLDADVQARINRVQSRSAVENAIGRLRRAGIRALNLDLMYGLPGQTSEHVEETASFAASQDANRVAVFGYAHVPWFKKHQNAIVPENLPSGDQRFRQAETAARVLVRAGYAAVGFDHFASPEDSLVKADRAGRLRRNFQGYTDDNADGLIAFGASAISMLPGLAWQNTSDTAAYRTRLAAGEAPVVRGLNISDEDRRIGKIIERILCRFEADIPADLRIEACPTLAGLETNRLVSWSGSHLSVTDRGRPYVRNVAAAFDPDLRASERAPARHSLAV